MSGVVAVSAGGSGRRPGATAVAFGAGALGVVGAAQLLGTDSGPELCVFRRWLGVECPGCGGARAAHHLVEGQLSAAWTDHPWVVLAAVQIVAAVVVAGALSATGRTGSASSRRTTLAVVGLLNAGALVALWAVRLATGSLPGAI